MNNYKQQFGKEGEKLALTYLRKKGYSIMAQNYRYGRSEIDLIVKIENIIVFVEVKTRETDLYGLPEDAISSAKMNKLAEGAEGYLYENKLNNNCRYDIVSIIKNKHKTEITHFEDAFWPGLY